MDYQHYRGEGWIKIPHRIRRRLHVLRYVGMACFIVSVAIPVSILTGAVESTFLLNFMTWTMLTLAPVFYVIGMVFNNIIDRAR